MSTSIENRPNRIRAIRLSLGLTLHEVATAAGTTPTQVARLEKGSRSLNRMWEQRLAKAMNVQIEELYSGLTNPSYRSKLLPRSDEIREIAEKSLKQKSLNRDFFYVCTQVCQMWQEHHPNHRKMTLQQTIRELIIIHDIFIDLYVAQGSTPELRIAMGQFFQFSMEVEFGAPVDSSEPKATIIDGDLDKEK